MTLRIKTLFPDLLRKKAVPEKRISHRSGGNAASLWQSFERTGLWLFPGGQAVPVGCTRSKRHRSGVLQMPGGGPG